MCVSSINQFGRRAGLASIQDLLLVPFPASVVHRMVVGPCWVVVCMSRDCPTESKHKMKSRCNPRCESQPQPSCTHHCSTHVWMTNGIFTVTIQEHLTMFSVLLVDLGWKAFILVPPLEIMMIKHPVGILWIKTNHAVSKGAALTCFRNVWQVFILRWDLWDSSKK